jgi:hypothetical protein
MGDGGIWGRVNEIWVLWIFESLKPFVICDALSSDGATVCQIAQIKTHLITVHCSDNSPCILGSFQVGIALPYSRATTLPAVAGLSGVSGTSPSQKGCQVSPNPQGGDLHL